MRSVEHGTRARQTLASLAGFLAMAFVMPSLAVAERSPHGGENEGHEHAKASEAADQSLADKIGRLQAEVARLKTALKQKHQGKKPETSGSVGTGMRMGNMSMGPGTKSDSMGTEMMGRAMMRGKDGMKGMGVRGKKGSMAGEAMGGQGMMGGMRMMGRMGGMSGAKPAEPLPAFPGAPGLYHIGATGFFLDLADRVALGPTQRAKLNRIKEEAMSRQAGFEQQIEAAEEELGKLTGSDRPDAMRIEAKVRQIARLRADRRMAFIRAVGQAAKVLTDEQRTTLTTQQPAVDQSPGTGTKPQP
ncbi:MAG TPA: periplasmic heavy metal sensor [Planctomycetaceae bacterium]|nr:periplasmic heavy metal sensor [Planctomycetaceae bacterium]HIQ23293.1 periplasmic heavy metal sensor [Planctomycetota bacterium]